MNRFRNHLFNLLLKNYRLRKNKIYDRLLNYAMNPVFPVKTTIHGRTVLIPSNYSYPFVSRNHISFNNPYLELVYQTYQVKKQKLVIADVGAAVGDTFLFLKANLPEAIGKVYCVEGSSYFLSFLKKNVGSEAEAEILNLLLSGEETEIPALIHHHGSSAMAAGKVKLTATTLDRLLERGQIPSIDVLKTDVDGYDGKVLKGATKILSELQPSVIFEFHPGLIKQAGSDILLAFKTLSDSGYNSLLWYDKFGRFCHQSVSDEYKQIEEIAIRSINGFYGEDWHYDIIALTGLHKYDMDSLKNCSFASTKPSPW